MDCVFCKIVAKEVPAEIVYEDKEFVSFLDINPVQFGHVLIIPKEHFPYVGDVPDRVIGEIFVKAKKLIPVIKDAMKADYVSVSVVGLDVPHFHVHLIPRHFNDGLASFWPTKKYSGGEMKDVAKKIRALL